MPTTKTPRADRGDSEGNNVVLTKTSVNGQYKLTVYFLVCNGFESHSHLFARFVWIKDFLAKLVALHSTPVSKPLSGQSFGLQPSSVAWSLQACFLPVHDQFIGL